MVQVVVLEDRPAHREELMGLLEQWPLADQLKIECAAAPDELRELVRRTPVDILLTDIDLGEGESSGIQLVQELFPAESGTQVIYMTGYPVRFCTEVYQTEHIYFLTKPLRREELYIALDRAVRNLSRREERRIAIQSGGRIIPLSTARIYYVESDRRLARLYTMQGTVESYISLARLLPQLGPAFVQCHKSFLINMAQVTQLESDSLLMKNGDRVPIGQAHRKEMREAYLSYLTCRL